MVYNIVRVLDWVITIPKKVSWDLYQQELNAVYSGELVLNYKTRYFPKKMKIKDRCFIIWNGYIRGWMEIVGLWNCTEQWECETTGTVWMPGKYIQRSGPFHKVEELKMTGFRGIRKLDIYK